MPWFSISSPILWSSTSNCLSWSLFRLSKTGGRALLYCRLPFGDRHIFFLQTFLSLGLNMSLLDSFRRSIISRIFKRSVAGQNFADFIQGSFTFLSAPKPISLMTFIDLVILCPVVFHFIGHCQHHWLQKFIGWHQLNINSTLTYYTTRQKSVKSDEKRSNQLKLLNIVIIYSFSLNTVLIRLV